VSGGEEGGKRARTCPDEIGEKSAAVSIICCPQKGGEAVREKGGKDTPWEIERG